VLSETAQSDACTRGIRVRVRSQYVPERSQPERSQWLFAYRISILNEGDETVKLLSRHWRITDATGQVEEVRGPGVVGEQPVLAPGEDFEYTSSCSLPTPYGQMTGTYQMITAEGERFDAEIAPFSLAEPRAIH
jgi:ApaG protein